LNADVIQISSPLSTKAQDCKCLANDVVSKTFNSSLKLPDLDESIAQRRENLYASKSKASKFITASRNKSHPNKRKSKICRKSNPFLMKESEEKKIKKLEKDTKKRKNDEK
jgi:hypothetical protein